MFSKLIAALHDAHLDMTAEEIADTLWLALQMGSLQGEVDIQHAIDATDPNIDEDVTADQQFPSVAPAPSRMVATASIHLHAQNRGDNTISYVASAPFRSPAASALPHTLALARALRPLMHRIPSKTAVVLNEHATAQRIAETRMHLWTPVFDPAPVRWFDIELVVDIGASMLLWKKTITELQALLEHLGAFRNVRIWRLATNNKDHADIYAGIGTTQEQAQVRNPKELINPGGYRLILVASDCVSPAWHSGKVQELLDLWGQKNLVTLIHMLPRRLWSQTVLENADIVQIYASRPEASNKSLKIKKTLTWVGEDSPIKQFLPLPTLTLEPNSFSSWAQILTGAPKTWVTGIIFEQSPIDISLDEDITTGQQEKDALSPEKRVQLFRTNASALARKLAGLLAAAPIPMSLPIIRQVQGAMLQEANQVHIAEVFLGGLLEEIYRDETQQDPDQVQYDFITGIRDELINTVPIPDAYQVLREISQFVRNRYGQPRDFLAFIAASQQGRDRGRAATMGSRPFAYLELNTLRRFGGPFVELIDELERYIQRINEQHNELHSDVDPDRTVLESPKDYSTALISPASPNPSFVNETWCNFHWADWLPLNSSEISTDPGIYRIRAVSGNEIFYIGSTGRNLRERISDLYRNIMKNPKQMPFSDPHTAAPTLWAWRDVTGIDFECSILLLSSQENLELLVHYFLWQYRLEKGDAALANYGRSHPLYIKSGNRSTGRRGYRLPEGSLNPTGGPDLEPLQLHGTPLERNWMELEWSEQYPLTGGNFKNIASSPAAYKVIDTTDMDTEELIIVGSTPNLRKRLQDLKQKNWDCPHPAVAFALQSPDLPHYQLAELESDLLGGYYEQMKKGPKAQFKLSQLDIITSTLSETDVPKNV